MSKLKQKLNQLPKEPGVYFHKNSKGQIIYVGKAAVLKNRVRQYFHKSRIADPKTDALVKEINDIDWVTVETELDALFLEAEMIKRYKPRYNIELRDDKSNLFVRIDFKSEHPTVNFTRVPMDDKAEYFGPYRSGYQVRKALKILRKAFPYDMKKPRSSRVSLDYHIGLSPGLEEGKTKLEDYRKNLKKLSRYLKGHRTEIMREIKQDMKKAAKNQNFEQAAIYRNQLNALNELRKQILFSDKEFLDISKDQALVGLADMLDLAEPPRRIEGFDISHLQGTNTVASMVVFTNGLPNKSQYRKFKMHTPGNDDFAHIYEVITRRFSKRNTKWPKPDLILIDGGKGQLSSAVKALNEKNIDVTAIGLAKKLETIIIKDETSFQEINLKRNSHVLKLLQRIRDESHRFAVSYHTTLKRSQSTRSILEDIPTIGPKTRKKLLSTFGSLKGVMQARDWEIEKLVGEKKAKVLKQYLRAHKKGKL